MQRLQPLHEIFVARDQAFDLDGCLGQGIGALQDLLLKCLETRSHLDLLLLHQRTVQLTLDSGDIVPLKKDNFPLALQFV